MKLDWQKWLRRRRGEPDDLLALFPSRIRLHREIHEIAPGAFLEVFWKSANDQQGPGAAVYIRAEEVVCFDCLGHPMGHAHIHAGRARRRTGRPRQDRVHFQETTIPDQVRRAAFEVRWNLRYYQQRHKRKRVREFDIDEFALARAADLLQERLDEFRDVMPGRFAGAFVDGRIVPSDAWEQRVAAE